MAQSIKSRTGAMSDKSDAREVRLLLDAALADLTAIRTSITGITAKLDADVGITDTNYAALHDPAALTTVS